MEIVPQVETLKGTVERVTYYNEGNGYTVLKIMPDRKYPDAAARDGTVAVVGIMPEIAVGEAVEFTGQWGDDPRFGRQFKAESVTPVAPTTEAGIISYLSSGLVKGIGERTAEKIVKHFGIRTLDVLDHSPERLSEVPGLKKDLADKLAKAWADNQSVRQTMIFLQGYGVTSKMAVKIYEYYGARTIPVVQEDPYTLASEVYGIGFIKADAIALSMGTPPDAETRIRAGLAYALDQLSKEGHTYAPREVLVAKAKSLLGLDNMPPEEEDAAQKLDTLVKTVLDAELAKPDRPNLISDNSVTSKDPGAEAIYLADYHDAECNAAKLLKRMAWVPSKLMDAALDVDWPSFLQELAQGNNVELTEQQQGAVKAALKHKVSVLTGGPGTGKTTTLKMAIRALQELDFSFALASPTGRAAKRLSEATGCEASTIHRLLGFVPTENKFLHNENNPLKVDMLIVDESSMIDLLLFEDLLRALKPETHLMLVGDVDQLPSVGAGNVLRDVIESGVAHVTRLELIFRQREDSHIVVNAHRINHGEAPYMDNKSTDFYFFVEEDPVKAAELVVDVVKNRLPNKFGIDPVEEVQVIAPMYRGPGGVNALNESLQKMLNGDKRYAEKQLGGRLFRVGDKVLQTRNNYDLEVFNGDIGRITAIDFDDQMFEVVMDGRYVFYEWQQAQDELMHAYCISTHRSQGSEYPVVVMPLLTQHYMMLQRNLLYTAVTRAKKMVVLVGSRRAVHIAVGNDKVARRYSGLQARLSS
jgi:exodeoxyribonuclease V alpha subunit